MPVSWFEQEKLLELFVFLFSKPFDLLMTVSSTVYFKAGNVGKKYLEKVIPDSSQYKFIHVPN